MRPLALFPVCGLILAVSSITSCTGNENDPYAEAEAMPVITDRGDNWSLVKKDGDFLYKNLFKNEPSAVVEGCFSVQNETSDEFTLYKVTSGTPTAIENCDNLASVGFMSKGLIPICRKNSHIEIVNKDGKTVFALNAIEDREIIACQNHFEEELLGILDENNNWGFVNRKGETIVSPRYDAIFGFSEGLCVVKQNDSVYSVIDRQGNTAITLNSTWIPDTQKFQEGMLAVKDRKSESIYLLDREGTTVKCPDEVNGVGQISSRFYEFCTLTTDGYRYGVMDLRNDKVIIPAKYEGVYFLPHDKFLAFDDNGTNAIYDSDGQILVNLDGYSMGVRYVPFFGIIGRNTDGVVLINENGTPQKDTKYYNIGQGISDALVETDFIDKDRIFSAIADVVNPAGFEAYKYGNAPSEMLPGDPIDYKDVESAPILDLCSAGYGYRYDTNAQFLKSISRLENPYNTGNGYYFTQANKLVGFTFQAIVFKPQERDFFDNCIKAIKSQGYKINSIEFSDYEGKAMLQCGDDRVVRLEVKPSYGDTILKLSVSGVFTGKELYGAPSSDFSSADPFFADDYDEF